MCLILYKPKGIPLPSIDVLDNAFENNPDGFGILVKRGKEVVAKKGLLDTNGIAKIVAMLDDDDEALLHWRLATHGLVNKDNCHPFPINGSGYAMHNGIFDIEVPKHGQNSDTAMYINKYNKKLLEMSDKEIMNTKEFGASRLALMHRDDRATRLIGGFTEYEGCMVSNTYSLEKPRTNTGYGGAYYGSQCYNAGYYGSDDLIRYGLNGEVYFYLADGTRIDQYQNVYTTRELDEIEYAEYDE